MAFEKITNAEVQAVYVQSAADQLVGTVQNNKAVFDALPQMIVGKYNETLDILNSTTEDESGASNIGATPISDNGSSTVQGILNELAERTGETEGEAHTHDNKELLDTYTQTEEDIAQAIEDDHTHDNKALLDTYTQTETDLSDAVDKKHSHTNLPLLDTYTQTEADISDAVGKKHAHSNLDLLETYNQTNANLSDAVDKKHSHNNMSVLNSIPSGGVVTSLGNDNTTIPTSKAVADAISIAGGGDMLKSSYDSMGAGNRVDKAYDSQNLDGHEASYYATADSVNNKYTKPSGGIPSNDLTAEVRASLSKADTALQSHQDISGKEDKSNKSTTITSSNTQYPTCNAVKTALNGKATTTTYNATIEPSGWFYYDFEIFYNTIEIDGISASDNPIVDIVIEDLYDVETMKELNDAWGKVLAIQTYDGAIEVYATEELDIDIPIQLKVVR